MDMYVGHQLPRDLRDVVAPSRTALLIVDMQNDFVHQEGYCARELGSALVVSFQSVIEPISRLARTARQAGVLVMYSRVVQMPDGSLASPVWLEDCRRYGLEPLQCMRNTWGYQIIDDLAAEPGDITVDKTRRSAFQGSILQNALTTRGIGAIVVVGVAATGCVEASVRDAIERDYFVVVPADAIANQNADLTDAAMSTFRTLLGDTRLTTVDTLTGIWELRS